jgi:hypothetical protein
MPELIQPSFAAGELSPLLLGRVDLAKYRIGCKTLRNAFVLPGGGAQNRAGTQFIAPTANYAVRSRLIPFAFNTTQTYVLVLGDHSMFVIKDGAVVLTGPGGATYSVATPYAAADLPLVKYTQSADVMTLVHPSYPVYQLQRTADNAWTFALQTFEPGIQPPTGVTATPLGYKASNGEYLFAYVVTSIAANGEESLPSASATCINNPGLASGSVYNSISWLAVTGAVSYNVYKDAGGEYGFIGNASGTGFSDQNIQPDTALTVETYNNPFANGNNPSCVEYHQQRLVFGNTPAGPDTLYFSQSADFNSFDTASPARASDAITIAMATKQVNAVRGLVSLNSLLTLTSGAAFLAVGGSDNVLTPSSVYMQPQSYIGCSDRPPLVCGSDVLYEQAYGTAIRDIRYDWTSNTYQSLDVSLLSSHLFVGFSLAEWCWSQEPFRQVWAVRNDGALLSMTFDRDQDVYAWSRHDTYSGFFESVCAVSEGNTDAVYVIANRYIGGGTVRYVERLFNRQQAEAAGTFLDCALQYSGAPVTTLSGLDYLDGQPVSANTSAGLQSGLVVTGGSITLPQPVTSAVVGLPITSQFQTVDAENNYLDTLQGKLKRISQVVLRLYQTGDIQVGSDFSHLRDAAGQDGGAFAGGAALFTGDVRVNVSGDWQRSGSVCVQCTLPVPVTLLDVMPYVEIGELPEPAVQPIKEPESPQEGAPGPLQLDPRMYAGWMEQKPEKPKPPPAVNVQAYANMLKPKRRG